MLKKFTLHLFSGVLCMAAVFSATARTVVYTSLEAFIDREKQQRDFHPVNGFWNDDRDFPAERASEHVSEAVFLALDPAQLRTFMDEKYAAVTFRVQMADGAFHDIDLVRYENFSGDFKVEAVAGDKVRTYSYTPGLHYRGVIAGMSGSVAAFSFFNEGVYGVFSLPGGNGGNYVLAPNSLLPETERNGRYMVYNDANLVNKTPGLCGTDQLPSVKDMGLTAGKTNRSVYNTCKDLEVYYQADFRTYQSFSNNVSQVADYITYVHNVVATLYANEEIYVSIKIIRVNEASDEYWSLPANSSFGFLNKFGDLTRNNLYGADVGVLLSTKGGSMGGVAWLNALCLPYTFYPNNGGHAGPYAFCNITRSTQDVFPTYSWDASMITHEIGHLIGSPHTHSCTWPGGPIDGCMPPDDGNCSGPYPSRPAGGGTIMSYCHIGGGTVSFTKGFGPLPGNLIRNNMRNGKSCVGEYVVNTPVTTPSTTLVANRECTDASGITYYYSDNNTADKSDDRLVMKIRKNGNNIGSLKTQLFTVSTTTTGGLGSGAGLQLALPVGTPQKREQAFAARRYFTIRPTQTGQSLMEFILPFTAQDSIDLSGSTIETPFDWSQINLYMMNDITQSPNPENGLSGVASSDLEVYSYGNAPSSSTWSISATGDTFFAHIHANGFTGGALYVNTPFPTSVAASDLQEAVKIYPNPARDQWHIILPNGLAEETAAFTLYGTDGRIAGRQALQSGVVNRVSAGGLAPGIYFFRITGGKQVYNGTLEKR